MASAYPSFKLVTEPNDSTSTVLLDFNDGAPSGGAAPRRVLTEGFSLGTPELEGDPDAIDPLWGDRTITVPVEVKGTKAQALAFFGLLSRTLLTGYTSGFIPGLWFRVQVEATGPAAFPVWYRLFRPQSGDLSWEQVYRDGEALPDRWQVTAELPAEAFGFGALETLSAQAVSNDPTSGTNRLRITLPALKGDAPTPVRVQNVTTGGSGSGARGLLVAHSSTATPTPVEVPIGGSDGLTAYTDTAASSSEAAAISGTVRVVNFATSTALVRRLAGAVPTMTPGRYKVLLMARTNNTTFPGATQTYTFRFRLGGSSLIDGPTVALTTSGLGATWVDLGDLSFPRVYPSGVADRGPALAGAFELFVGMGTGTPLSLDHLLFVPLDVAAGSDWRSLQAPISGPTTATAVVDGDMQDAWRYTTATGVLAEGYQPATIGVFPRFTPGRTNTLWVVNNTNDTGYLKTNGSNVTVSYYPRYLNLPGV